MTKNIDRPKAETIFKLRRIVPFILALSPELLKIETYLKTPLCKPTVEILSRILKMEKPKKKIPNRLGPKFLAINSSNMYLKPIPKKVPI
jgi:hypothetical protein